jgi:Ca-activated chloride channel homolog
MALAGVVFFVLVCLAGLAINIAYISMLRTEQRIATDSIAKASLVVLGQTQSRTEAINAGKSMAAMFRIAGRPIILENSDIEIGMSAPQPNGTFNFTSVPTDSTMVLNAVKVNCDLDSVYQGGIPLLVSPESFTPSKYNELKSAIATRIEMDICLVVDRSASMAWNLGSASYEYPEELSGRSPIQNYFELPHPTHSRWAALRSATDVFVNVLDEAPIKSRVALASYSSNFTFGIWTSTVASIDQPLSIDYTDLATRLDEIAESPLIGNTNIAAGIREGVNALTDPTVVRVTSSKCMIVLTDGIKTQGDDPVELANLARSMNIRIHTIAFSEGADRALMERVAVAGGGQSYYAPDADALELVFRTIATTLPNMIVN